MRQMIRTARTLILCGASCAGAELSAQQRPTTAALVAFIDSAAPATLRGGPVAGLSILVARGSTVLVDTAYGYADLENGVPASRQTVYEVGSVTKQFTAAAIMRLVEQGKVHLDDDVAPYFPRFPFGGRHVTIRQLLTHTSGIHNYVELPTRDTFLRLPLSRDSLLATIYGAPFDFEPGMQWRYSNTGYHMLGMIIEAVSGISYPDFLQRTFFTPLGMMDTRSCNDRPLVPHRARGYEVDAGTLVNAIHFDQSIMSPAGGVCSTTHDLLTWSRALQSGRAVSAASYRAMATEARLPNGGPETYYGYGLTLTTLAGHRAVWHDGGEPGFRARVTTFPDDSLVVIVLANTIAPQNSGSPPANLEIAIDQFALGVPDIQHIVGVALEHGGVDSAIREYRALRRRYPAAVFGPDQLNSVAYASLHAGKVADAISVFRLNVEMFPEDWNAYDSLGEGYMVHGDKALAVANYEHSLKLNPANANGTHMLETLKAQSP